MKINEIIRKKRKELELTQEQLAAYLGVSTPAVNKWEKGVTYPDITILPMLARLLKVDLNTLLSFQEDLTEKEVGNFTNEMSILIGEKGYDFVFQKAMEKIQEYPNCDLLILSVSLTLEGALFMFAVENREKYLPEIEELYERAANSKNEEIRNQASSVLISRYMGRGEYQKSQTLLDSLPNIPFPCDKNQIQSNLYIKQGRFSEAAELLERKLMNAANDIQISLNGMIKIAQKEKDNEAAEYFADIAKKTVKLYDLWEYGSYVAHFHVAGGQKNSDRCIEILQSMLPAAQEKWDINSSPLYKHIKVNSEESNLQKQIPSALIADMQNDKDYEFLRSNPEYHELVNKYKQ